MDLNLKLFHPTVKLIYVIALTLIFTPQAFAEIDFLDLKGSRESLGLKQECSYLSPEVALCLVRQGKLNQDYIYGDEKNPSIQLVRMAFKSASDNPAFFQI